jgi:hypothetical protein
MPINVNDIPPSAADNPNAFEPRHPVLGDAALQGLPGKVVRELDPYTEADKGAVLVTFLAAAGAMIGKDAHIFAGDVEHPCRLWPLVIGPTAGGMKGTSWASVRRVFDVASRESPVPMDSGLSSAEGLIEAVRDDHGVHGDHDFREGVADKRLIIVESEFASVLARGKREGNALAQTMRDAWDGSRLSTIVRGKNRLSATGHHIVVIGHITAVELRTKLADSDVAGGSMNRFLTVCSRRSKRLPGGGGAPDEVVDKLARELRDRVTESQACGRIGRDDEAERLWHEVYESLTPDVVVEGHYAAVVARAVPQVMRLALTYALLDVHQNKVEIGAKHLRAALAVWEYAQASAWFVFGDLAANVDLVRICEAVDEAEGQSLTRTEISGVFSNNKSAAAISELIRQAVATGGYETSSESGKPGRPTVRLTKITKKPLDAPEDVYELNERDEEIPLDDRLTSSPSFRSHTVDQNVGGSPPSPDNQICPSCGSFKNPWRRVCPECEDLPRKQPQKLDHRIGQAAPVLGSK